MSLSPEEAALIGGSDAAAVAGIHPNRNAFDVFARIVDGVETPDNKLFRRGRLMEPVIRAIAAEDLHLSLLGPRKLRDPKRPHVRGSLDDVHQAPDCEEPVEFKSVSPFAMDRWGPSGTDEVPTEYICQVQFYMGLAGAPRARLVALVGLDDLREYVLHADLELQGMLFESVDRFHRDHILTRKPPAIDGSESCSGWLAQRFAAPSKDVVPADPELERWAVALRDAKAAMDSVKARKTEAENRIKLAIGSAYALKGEGWRASWASCQGRESTDWESVAREASVPSELIAKHTKRGNPYRTLRTSGPLFKSSEGDAHE